MRKAFTLIELVFVLVIIGVLATAILPRTKTNPTQEGAIKLASHIRYTQHLALSDDTYSSKSKWYQHRWQIVFNDNKYSIVNEGTYAKIPGKKMRELKDISLKGLTINLSAGCVGKEIISFDYLGRPLVGDLNDDTKPYMSDELLTSKCDITVTDGKTDSVISISPETGYVSVKHN